MILQALIPRYADNIKKINNTRFEILNATFASDLILDKKNNRPTLKWFFFFGNRKCKEWWLIFHKQQIQGGLGNRAFINQSCHQTYHCFKIQMYLHVYLCTLLAVIYEHVIFFTKKKKLTIYSKYMYDI